VGSLKITITGMTCGHCRMKVEKAITGVSGVYGAAVDLHAGAAEVDFDERRTDAGRIVSAVEAAGYGARAEPLP
jgi:copper chaperone CopZ